MSRFACLVAFYFVLFVIWPSDAFAWGPAVHVDLAMKIIVQAAAFAPAIRKLLEKHPNDFIYGNLSADIILGKKYIDYYYHCHNWRVGMEILENAKTDPRKAFALGYLSHLAADVVAHNVFVPDKLVRTYETVTAKHAYWEVRYDLRMDHKLIERGYEIAKEYHTAHDPLLEDVLRDTLFSFQTNKKIFNGLLLLQKQSKVREFLRRAQKRSPLVLDEKRAAKYQQMSEASVISVLQNLDKSESFKADPAGLEKIDLAGELRKTLRLMQRQGAMKPREVEKVIKTFHDILHDTLYAPAKCPDAEGIILVSV